MQTIHCEAVLFDLDGVLVDSGVAIDQGWRKWAAHYGIDADAILGQMHGRRSEDTIAEFAPHVDIAEGARVLLEIELQQVHFCRPYAGAHALFAALEGHPHGVVTSGEMPLASARLRQVNLPIPKVFVTADQLSAGKPDPEGYLLAAERLGKAPGRCVVCEDSRAGLKAAKAAGMTAIGVATTSPAGVLTEADIVVAALSQVTAAARDGVIELTIAE